MKVRRLKLAPALRCGNQAVEVALAVGVVDGRMAAAKELGRCDGSAFVWVEVPGGHVPLCQLCYTQLLYNAALSAVEYELALGIGMNSELTLPIEFPAGKWDVVSDGSFVLMGAENFEDADIDYDDDSDFEEAEPDDDDDSDLDNSDLDDSEWEEVDDDDDWQDDDEDDDEDDEDEDFEAEMFGVFCMAGADGVVFETPQTPIALLQSFPLAQNFLTAWLTQADVPTGSTFIIVKANVVGSAHVQKWYTGDECYLTQKG